MTELSSDDSEMHAAWIGKCADTIVSAELTRRGNPLSIPSRTKSGTILRHARAKEKSWLERLQEPWILAQYARAAESVAAWQESLREGRAPRGPELADLCHKLRLKTERIPPGVPIDGFADGVRRFQAQAKLRARIVGWWARLESIAGREPDLSRLPDALRLDPCSGQPFRVTRVENAIVVHGLGLDRDDDGGRESPVSGASWFTKKPTAGALIDGDIVERVALP